MKKIKILVVEDETIVALDIENSLIKLGYSVCATVEDGLDAIKKTAELKPDLVLMDIHLRGLMNGIEAAKEIYDKSQIPSIYLTANSDLSTFEKAKLTEPLAYLNKPFRARELNNTIELTLSRFRQEDSSTTRKQGGLGLGLAIARHIVELHGGSIGAFSEGEGKGATFTFQLPLLNS